MSAPAVFCRLQCLFLALALVAAPAQAARPKAGSGAKPSMRKVAPVVAPEPTPMATRCSDDDQLRLKREPATGPEAQMAQTDPRSYLIQVAETAVQRSRQVGVAQLLAQSAQEELRDAELAHLPQAQLQLSGFQVGSITQGVSGSQGLEARASLQLSGPLWDWGQRRQLVEWRRQLAEAAQSVRQGQAEQIALQAVSLSLDRSRYTLQVQVYGQYMRKMACLVEALEAITQFDKGRASELIQAQKQQQQAELALVSTRDFLRTIETRLTRLVGDPLPPPASLSAVLARVPELAQLQKDLLLAPDVNAANAQALAAQRFAESVSAGQKPQLGWQAGGNIARGNGHNADWSGGVQVIIPLYRAGDAPQREAALRRADAVNLQRDETLDAKHWRLTEIHDAANNALDRARRTTELLRASQQLRAATLQQWQQLGRRSLFDVMGAEADYYSLRVAQVNALYDAQQAVALMGSMGRGVTALLR